MRPDITVHLPEWTNATGGDKAAWDAMVAALRIHEEGHIKIAQCHAEQIAADPVSASGPTAPEALAALEAKIVERGDQVVADDARLQKEYDTQTDSGANQAAVGGTSAIFDCHHPPP